MDALVHKTIARSVIQTSSSLVVFLAIDVSDEHSRTFDLWYT